MNSERGSLPESANQDLEKPNCQRCPEIVPRVKRLTEMPKRRPEENDGQRNMRKGKGLVAAPSNPWN
jgi:hypothetical protein